MKNIYRNSIVLFVCLFTTNLQAKEINKQTAEKVAINAFAQLDNNKNASDFQVKEILTVKSEEEPSFYVVNFNPTGFIILSASDAAIPILGSSTESNFSFENLPPQLAYLLDFYKVQIKEIEKQKIAPTNEIKQKWNKYTDGFGMTSNSLKSASATLSQVSPLLQTHWNQNAGWNQFCPGAVNGLPGYGGRVPVGCAGVALAQVLKYWDCKVNESGVIVDLNYNNLTVNLTESDYSWSNMGLSTPDVYNARLLYDCALACQTFFSDSASAGSTDEGMYALVNNFGFKNNVIDESSSSYSPGDWLNKLKNELNQGKPIIYEGTDFTVQPSVSHGWVIDGYDANDKFHCNWGWGGSHDTYYYISNLNPNYSFNTYNWAMVNIEPVMPNCEEVNGSCFVSCNGTSYNVNLLPGDTIVWGKSDNITRVSAQYSNPCTFQSNGSGPGWIEATIHNNGSAVLDRKDIWVGLPTQPGAISIDMDAPPFRFTASINEVCGATSYNWYIDGVMNTVHHGSMAVFSREDPYCGTEYDVQVEAVNSCGASEKTFLPVFEPDCLYRLQLSPNPTANESTVELISVGKTAVDLNTEWDLDIYDTMQRMKEKKTKIKGNQTKLNTASWKDGVYIVRAKIGEKIISEKLVVKH